MKQLLLSILLMSGIAIVSCTTDAEWFTSQSDTVITKENKSDVDIMSFSTYEDYFKYVDYLSTLDKDSLQSLLDSRHFESLYDLHENAMNEISTVHTEEEYQHIVEKYKDVLIFNQKDPLDYSVYRPVENLYKCMVLNRYGQVKIDGVTVNELDYTSENYPFDSFDDIIPTRSGNVDIRSGENEIFVLANHRKLFVNFYKYGSDQAKYEVKTRKRVLGGWYDYNNTVYFQYPNGTQSFDSHGRCTVFFPLPMNGLQILMWSDGVGSDHKATMTISY